MDRVDKCILALNKGITYCEETGNVYGVNGNVLKRKDNQGYICFGIWYEGKTYLLYAHQFAWYCIYGECIEMIDHKNQIKTDNRKSNLRSATRQINTLNRNSKGYSFDKSKNKWMAQIMINGKNVHLGRFRTKSEAREVYLKKKKELLNN